MCGIAGVVDPARREHRDGARRMAEAIAHRGPDDRGFWADDACGVALGHDRLSIIDLSPAGRQPMAGEDGRATMVFNGEIYNFRELRSALESAGHRFSSMTDCEVVVHGYEEWGSAVVDRLRGMFAFALWDARDESLFLARDPMGIKPLYWRRSRSGAFFFASELKGLLAAEGFDPDPDEEMIRAFLEFNFVPDEERTAIRGVRKLPASSWLRVRARDVAAGDLRPVRYFSPPAVEESASGEDPDSRADRLFDVLTSVVEQHLVADVPVALLLSGGLDSSILAALAARRGPLRTLTMAFGDSDVDERSFARIVARHIGSVHSEIVIEPAEMSERLEKDVWWVDDLFGDWGVLSTRLLYRRCREEGYKVVLVGEGSDELFGGYPQFRDAAGPATDRWSGARRALRLYQAYSGRRWGRELGRFARIWRSLSGEAGGDAFSALRLFECRFQLPNDYNMKVDKASMASGVEARVPYLDRRVAEEGFRTPRSLLMRNGTNKILLRRAAEKHGLLPPEILERPKFGGSIAPRWIETSPAFRAFARDVVVDGRWTRAFGLRRAMSDYFDRNVVGYPRPKALGILSIAAWRLLMLNLWSRHYLSAGGGAR